jgi:hypothetical protein
MKQSSRPPKSAAALLCADHGGNALDNRGLFTDYKFQFFLFSALVHEKRATDFSIALAQ